MPPKGKPTASPAVDDLPPSKFSHALKFIRLRPHVTLQPGLTPQGLSRIHLPLAFTSLFLEISKIEHKYNLKFPPDLVEFYSLALPVGFFLVLCISFHFL